MLNLQLCILSQSQYDTIAEKHNHCLLEYVKKGTKGGSSIVISVLLMLMIVSVFSPVSGSTHIVFRGTFSFASNTVLYLLLYFVNCFLVGFAYAGLGYSVSIFTNDILLPYIIPQCLYLCRLFYPFKSDFLLHILPIDTYDIAGKTRPLYEHVYVIDTFYTYYVKNDENNWGDWTTTLNVTKIQFGYQFRRIKNEADIYELVPCWIFFQNNSIILVLNAVDGTVFNSGLNTQGH